MNKFYLTVVSLIFVGLTNVFAQQDFTADVTVSKSNNPMVRLTTDGGILGSGLCLRQGGAHFHMNPAFSINFDTAAYMWNIVPSTYTPNPMASSSTIIAPLRLNASTFMVDAQANFSESVNFQQKVEFKEYASFRNSATFYPDGVFETTSIDDRGLRTSNRFALYAGSLREALYPHLEILSGKDASGNSKFLVSTKNEGPGGFTPYAMDFAAKDFDFEGNYISLKKPETDSSMITLSEDGTVSAVALELRGAGGKNLTAKFDEKASAWNLEGSSSLNVNTGMAFNKDVSFNKATWFGNDVIIRSPNNGRVISWFGQKGVLASDRMCVYTNGDHESSDYRRLELSARYDSVGDVQCFLISTRYGESISYPLKFGAEDFSFHGNSLSVKKALSDSVMINLSGDGTVNAGALKLRQDGVDSGKKPTLEIQYNGEESAWNLGATGDSATAPLNVKVSKLNVDGPIVCKDRMKVAEIEAEKMRVNDVTVNMDHAADYVFDENYDLKSLDEVEAFVKENKHLPGVPSASKMKEEGMSLSEMSNLLLEKVEELTLHLIRVEKENRALKAEMERMRNEK